MSSVTQRTRETAPSRQTCPECDGRVRAHGTETVCTDCGLVTDEHAVDPGPEWRGSDESDQRAGPPTTDRLHNKGLGSHIGNGRGLPKRQRQLHEWTYGGPDKTYRLRAEAFGEINRIAAAVGSPNATRAHACRLFSAAQDAGEVKGRSLEAYAGACLLAAARLNHEPVTTADVTDASRVEDSKVRRTYLWLQQERGLAVPPMEAATLVPRYCSALDIDNGQRQRAMALACGATDIAGRKAQGIAAAAVYLASPDPPAGPTQREVAAVADVTPVTVRNAKECIQADT